MSKEVFDDSDPDNEPAVFGLPRDHPVVRAMCKIYHDQTTLDERRAWHAVTCLNSREPATLELFARVVEKIQRAVDQVSQSN